MTSQRAIQCDDLFTVRALRGVPTVNPGDDLVRIIGAALDRSGVELLHNDVLVVVSKVISRAEDRFVDVSTVAPGRRAERLGKRTGKDPRLVELVLREAAAVSRVAQGALIVRHRLGFVCADAGIDFSNAAEPAGRSGTGPWALLLPEEPDRSAARLREALQRQSTKRLGVIVSDSHGRPFRLGTIGSAIGVSGLPALWDRRGDSDRFGRMLEHTQTALADQLATAADLVAGQADESRPVMLLRGLSFDSADEPATRLCRPREHDLYAPAFDPEASRDE
jgi:coenzyme F420-0:L-glutamate ligase / coenzyme F420-1:gamma-L-glutamate ligase